MMSRRAHERPGFLLPRAGSAIAALVEERSRERRMAPRRGSCDAWPLAAARGTTKTVTRTLMKLRREPFQILDFPVRTVSEIAWDMASELDFLSRQLSPG